MGRQIDRDRETERDEEIDTTMQAFQPSWNILKIKGRIFRHCEITFRRDNRAGTVYHTIGFKNSVLYLIWPFQHGLDITVCASPFTTVPVPDTFCRDATATTRWARPTGQWRPPPTPLPPPADQATAPGSNWRGRLNSPCRPDCPCAQRTSRRRKIRNSNLVCHVEVEEHSHGYSLSTDTAHHHHHLHTPIFFFFYGNIFWRCRHFRLGVWAVGPLSRDYQQKHPVQGS